MKEYNYIFSLGEACLCASGLRILGLRSFSGPFDWVFGATITERIDLIINDFNGFFEKEDLIFDSQRKDQKPNDIYYNKRTKITFNHDFPLDGSFDSSYLKIKDKYNRRTSRILSILKSKKPTLIVFMELPNNSINGINNDAELVELSNKLQNKFNNKNIDILYIKHDEQMKDGEVEVRQINENISIGSCFNENRENGDPLNINNVKLLFKNIAVKNQKLNKIKYYIKKRISKFCGIFYKKKIKNGVLYNRICGVCFRVK